MDYIDAKCSALSDFLFYVLYLILTPGRFFIKYLTSYFQRPYSFCFLLGFLLLMTPSLLLVVLLIQNFEFINLTPKLNQIFYFTLIHLIINYVLTFHIYYLYGQHHMEEVKPVYTVKSFTKFTLDYLFKNTRSGLIGIYFFIQIVVDFVSLNELNSNTDFNSEKFDFPVIIYFTKIGVFLNLVFTLTHVCMYLLLYGFILCKVNNSCICKVIKSGCTAEKEARNVNVNDQSRKNQERRLDNRNKYSFQNLALDFYDFFGLYEYKKQLGLDSGKNIIDLDNDNL